MQKGSALEIEVRLGDQVLPFRLIGSRFKVQRSRLKNTDTHTGTDFDEKEHERLRKIEKKF